MTLPLLTPEQSSEYERKCQDVDLALAVARERVEEWDRDEDPHGWWHERSVLIALHNEVIRLRSMLEPETEAQFKGKQK